MANIYCYGCECEFEKSEVMIEEGIKGKVWICPNCFRSDDVEEELDEE